MGHFGFEEFLKVLYYKLMLVFNLLVLTCMLIVVILKMSLISETVIPSHVSNCCSIYLWKVKKRVVIIGWRFLGWMIVIFLDGTGVLKGICNIVLHLFVKIKYGAFLIMSDLVLNLIQLLLKIPFAIIKDVAIIIVIIFRVTSMSAWLFDKHRAKVSTARSVLVPFTLQVSDSLEFRDFYGLDFGHEETGLFHIFSCPLINVFSYYVSLYVLGEKLALWRIIDLVCALSTHELLVQSHRFHHQRTTVIAALYYVRRIHFYLLYFSYYNIIINNSCYSESSPAFDFLEATIFSVFVVLPALYFGAVDSSYSHLIYW